MRRGLAFMLILGLGLGMPIGCESDPSPSFKPLTAEQYRDATRSRTSPSTDRRVDTSGYNARTYRANPRDLPASHQRRLQSQATTDPDGSPKVNMPN